MYAISSYHVDLKLCTSTRDCYIPVYTYIAGINSFTLPNNSVSLQLNFQYNRQVCLNFHFQMMSQSFQYVLNLIISLKYKHEQTIERLQCRQKYRMLYVPYNSRKDIKICKRAGCSYIRTLEVTD